LVFIIFACLAISSKTENGSTDAWNICMGCRGFKTKYHTNPISAIVFAMELSVGLLCPGICSKEDFFGTWIRSNWNTWKTKIN
jgi:hypothetical protein